MVVSEIYFLSSFQSPTTLGGPQNTENRNKKKSQTLNGRLEQSENKVKTKREQSENSQQAKARRQPTDKGCR